MISRVYLTKPVEVPAFGSVIAWGHTKSTMMMGHRLRVMTQVPYPDDDANLPVSLYVLRMYTELHDGSRTVHVVLRNGTSHLIHLCQCQLVGQVVAANLVPEAEVTPEFMEKLSEDNADTNEKEKSPKLMILEWQQLLIEILEWDSGLDMLKDWPEKEALDTRRLLMEFHHVFSLDKNEMGCIDTTEHVIKLTNSEPFKERFWCIAPLLVEEVHEHIQEMLDGGAIRPTNSPWCNTVVLVRKKDGTLRFCIDFCRLNERTEKDSFPMPRMIDTMETMVGAKIFSSMDLKSGFWQVKMAEESRPYTALMVGSLGVYEFLQMPFGLCNAPATFQRLMQNCLGELNLTYALIYLDDVVVFANTEAEHLKRLRAVFERFHEHGLKLKLTKCDFFKSKITYLGHQVSAEGMKPGIGNWKGIAEMVPPTTAMGIQRFLGAMGFYRRFIKGYAKIAQPLNDLISDENSKLKNQTIEITVPALKAFHELKLKCMQAPVLAFADFHKPFLLETDASSDGLSSVLSQKQEDGKYHPVAYASQSLKGSESKYHSSKLEFLALKWAVVDQFREYLQYKPFHVKTDNNPLIYVMTLPNLDATGHRWVAALAGYNMMIEYIKGSDNKVANCLSRVTERLDADSVRELIQHAKACGTLMRADMDDPRLAQEDARIDDKIIIQARVLMSRKAVLCNVVNKHWVSAQATDPVIRPVQEWMARPRENKISLSEHLNGKVADANHLAFVCHQKDL